MIISVCLQGNWELYRGSCASLKGDAIKVHLIASTKWTPMDQTNHERGYPVSPCHGACFSDAGSFG